MSIMSFAAAANRITHTSLLLILKRDLSYTNRMANSITTDTIERRPLICIESNPASDSPRISTPMNPHRVVAISTMAVAFAFTAMDG